MGFFDFFKGKKKNDEVNKPQENLNESNNIDEIEGIEITPFEVEETKTF